MLNYRAAREHRFACLQYLSVRRGQQSFNPEVAEILCALCVEA